MQSFQPEPDQIVTKLSRRMASAHLSAFLERATNRLRGSQTRVAEATEPLQGFDWRDYRDAHRDLKTLKTPDELRRHYETHGRAEGRLASAAAVAMRIDELQKRHGALPEDFVWTDYLGLHADLRGIASSYAAAEHYLRFGRSEGRLYGGFDAELYRSLNLPGVELPPAAVVDHFNQVGKPAGLIATADQLAALHGLKASRWIALIDVAEFDLLNADWAGRVTNKRQALDAMVREGFDRVAPIAFAVEFDPDYYREANPRLAPLGIGDLYRHWLFEGRDGDRPGTAAEHLRRHGLALGAFPEGFDWARYRTVRGVFGDSRWALLDHLVANNAIAAADVPVHPAGAAAFLAALAGTIGQRVPARGVALFAVAQQHGALSAADEEQWGQALARQQNWSEALVHYEAALADGQPTVTVAAAAAEAAGRLGDFARAAGILRHAGQTVAGDIRFRTAVKALTEAAFRAAWTQAESLYAAERRAEADAVMLTVCDDIARWWSELDPIGLPVPAEPVRRVVLLANVDLPQCTHYRVEQKQEIFAAAGIPLAVYAQDEVEAFLAALPGAAAALFYRLPASPMTIRAITAARALGIPSYYDIDDLLFDPAHYPEPVDTYGLGVSPAFYQSLQLGVPLFRAAMALCDFGIASTTILAEHMRGVVRANTAFVLPNGLDSHNTDYLAVRLPKVQQNDDVVLFYGSGTKAHNSDFLDLVGDALVAAMTREPRVRLLIAGHLSLDDRFDPLRERIVQVGWTKDLPSYWSLLAEADINLAVLAPGATTDAKSEIKWLEAAALGVPSIVSATHRYREVLVDGVDALLAGTAAEWRSALDRLIADPALRASIVTAARAKAAAQYGLAENAVRLKTLLEPALVAADARDLPPGPRRKRLLLVNIFFPPQTIGGSTRVARDNLDSFLRSPFAQECDFAVVTTDNDNPVPFGLRVEDYRGVPVFRMSTPIEPNMEWRPFNPAIGAVFARVLEMWRPDLVHVHSIQRSTASILEECWVRGIPYINTIHDAWWVADYHFLVDDKGRLRAPGEALPLHPPRGVDLGEALERRRRLRVLLEHSAEILCVSDAFTAIHHRAGYPRARSVPNGVPPMPATPRTRSLSGRVRLAQIGSQTHHKGYSLIQAALKRSRFRNLELTVVEHGRFGGRVEQALWGETPVFFVGKTKQEEMHTFYAGQDVLLAPSLWPESFGLVAREASAAGLWVLASDRGAIGENVIPGTNGWVIDVSSVEPLIGALAEMDDDPAHYLQPPPRVAGAARTAEDQARDLVGIYRDVLARPPQPDPLPWFMRGGFALEEVAPERGRMARPPRRPRWP